MHIESGTCSKVESSPWLDGGWLCQGGAEHRILRGHGSSRSELLGRTRAFMQNEHRNVLVTSLSHDSPSQLDVMLRERHGSSVS